MPLNTKLYIVNESFFQIETEDFIGYMKNIFSLNLLTYYKIT